MGLPGCSQPEIEKPIKPSQKSADEWAVGTTLLCRECGAPLRPDQDWCSLCYAAVKPVFDPLTAPLDDVISVGSGEDEPRLPAPPPQIQSASAPEPAVEPASVDEPPVDPELKTDVSDVDVMLSMLAAEHRRNEPASGLAERFEDRSTRIAVMVFGTALIGAALFAILTVLGAFV